MSSLSKWLSAGLLPLLRAAITDIQIAIFANQTVAVDAYSWLHKGAYSCAMELVEGKKTTQYATS
jgi:exonuclease-1